MKERNEPQHGYRELLRYSAEAAEATRIDLHHALDRFEHGKLVNLPSNSKLTLRNLGSESGKDKNTAISRYRKPDPKAGQYRFPDVAERYIKLKARLSNPKPAGNQKDEKIRELREIIKIKDEKLLLSARVNNQLDAENSELQRKKRELEHEVARLRQDNMRLVSLRERGKTDESGK